MPVLNDSKNVSESMSYTVDPIFCHWTTSYPGRNEKGKGN